MTATGDETKATGAAHAAPIRFDPETGLIPVVLRDDGTGAVLMVGFMNPQALARTRETGHVHFWSRSRAKLWMKGETSGHVARVREIRVNCERNSLLVSVTMAGPVCHDGYDTCYYRTLNDDDTLTVVEGRRFDPATVYRAGAVPAPSRSLRDLSRLHYGAYEYLRDHDLGAQSGTSRRLRAGEDVSGRVADELAELAGALDGTHRHADPRSDIVLEAGQVIYWLTLVAVMARRPWDEGRPDRAIVGGNVVASDNAIVLAGLLRGLAEAWRRGPDAAGTGALAAATLALVGQVLAARAIDPRDVIEADLASLRDRSYLQPYFAGAGASPDS